MTDLVEKPAPAEAPSDLAIIGRYILTPQIFEHLARTRAGSGGEIQLTDGLRSLLSSQAIYAYRFQGTRYDTGDKLGFLKATVEFALRRRDLGGPFRAYLRGLDLDAPGLRQGATGEAGRSSGRRRTARRARSGTGAARVRARRGRTTRAARRRRSRGGRT